MVNRTKKAMYTQLFTSQILQIWCYKTDRDNFQTKSAVETIRPQS